MNKPILTAIAIACLSCGAFAQEKFACPPGASAVSTGAFNTPSCVGSNIQGLVEQTLPFNNYNYLGAQTARVANPLFTQPQRPEVDNGPTLPRAIGHIASVHTFMSAPEVGAYGITGKLAADWKFIFESPLVTPSARMAWMGGFLSRSLSGELSFSTQYGSDRFDGFIGRYRNDIQGFMGAVGYSTAKLFQERYGMEASFHPEWQAANARMWDQAMTSRSAPNSSGFMGYGSQEGGAFATVVFGADGLAHHIIDAHGQMASLDEYSQRPEFTALTGRGIARR